MACSNCGGIAYSDNNSYASRTSREYKQQINAWFNTIQRDFKKYLPEGFSSSYFSTDMPDMALYAMARSLESQIQSKMSAKKEKQMKFEIMPYKRSNGDVILKNLTNSDELTIKHLPNGLYAFTGADYLVEAVGGRGKFDTILKNMQDDDYFHDNAKKK
jgi:hypothetical protein